MGMTQIHADLKGLSKDNPAAYIRTDYFAYRTLGGLKQAVDALRGKEIVAGTGVLSVRLIDLKWSKTPDITLARPHKDPVSRLPVGTGTSVDVLITSGFDLVLEIVVTKKSHKVISEVILSVADARIRIHGESNVIVSDEAMFSFTPRIVPTSDAKTILKAEGIDLDEATRVEGHIGYGIAPQAIRKALSQPIRISLSEFFPAFNFGTAVALEILDGGKALGIVPRSRVVPRETARCECAEGHRLEMSASSAALVAPADPTTDPDLGKVTVGGPMAESKDPMKDFGRRVANADGIVGIYLPKAFAGELTVKVIPAIILSVSQGFLVGYEADATVGFEDIKVSIDTAGGGILVDVKLKLLFSAYCWLDILCTKLPIGWAEVRPAPRSNAKLQLGFYPSASLENGVQLKSTLKSIDMGSYVAMVVGIGSALAIFGVTAWIALLDVALAAIIVALLPDKLKEAVSKAMGANEWKLIDGVLSPDPKRLGAKTSPFDATDDSLLISYDLVG